MRQRIVHIFFDVDMRNQHDGLAAYAKKHNVDVNKLEPLTHVIFINRALDRLKMYSCKGVLSYLRVKGGIDLEAIQYIPEVFVGNDVSIAYAKALRKRLQDKLGNAK